MAVYTKTANDVFAPTDAGGALRSVQNADVQTWGTEIERLIMAIIAETGDLDLPNLLIRYTITGGTANAIEATPNLPPPDAPGEALFSIQITADNTGPVTINGKSMLTNSGNQLAAGGLVVGGIYLFLDDGVNFRLVSDQASAAVLAAAEEAQLAAEAAQLAAESAAGANLANADSRAAAILTNIPETVAYIRTAGYSAAGVGRGAVYKRGNGASPGGFVSADGAGWELVPQPLHLSLFGGTNAAALTAAATAAKSLGIAEIEADAGTITVGSAVDMQGVGIIGQGTIIGNTSNLLNVGPLRNCVVRGFPTEGDILAHLTPTRQTPKLLVCANPDDALWLFANDANGRPLRHILRYDTFSSNPTDAGVASEVWRPTDVFGLDKVFVYQKAGVRTGTWGAETNAPFGGFFGPGTVGGRAFRYRSTTVQNSDVTFTVGATAISQKCRVGIYATAGSSTANEILVNGVSQRTFSAVLVAGFPLLLIEVELTAMGDNEVTVRKTSSGASSLSVIGANVVELQHYRGETVDEYAYGETARQYLFSTAANDYAFHSIDEDKWFGSLHGGETKRSEPVLLTDRTIFPIPSVQGNFVIAQSFQFQQRTEIRAGTDYMNVARTDTYRADGHYRLAVSMAGSAKVDRAFTCMTAAHWNFRNLIYPREISSPGVTELVGRSNMVTQIAPIGPTEQMVLSTLTTLFPMGGKYGANMLANGPYINNQADTYSKVYYGPVAGSEVTLPGIAFETERLFG